MSKTDTPFKQLFTQFGKEIAEWLLDTPIKSARHTATELPPLESSIRADYVLELTLPDDRQLLLHTEFQGSSSERPVPRRMLDYNNRLSEQTGLPVCSVIIYLGKSTGATDTGQHQSSCPITGKPSVWWHYQVFHLWQMKAEELLALNNPILLTLIGQTQVAKPAEIFPQVLANIGQQTQRQQSLLQLFMSLLAEEEWFKMVEQLLEENPILDTPYMRRERVLRLEIKKEVLYELLEKRFGTLPNWVTEKLENATIEELEQWNLRILDANNLEQIMVEQLPEKDPISGMPFMPREQTLRLEGEKKMFSRLLEKRFDTLPNWAIEKLENATIKELEQWSLRILEVDSLEQVFEQGLVKNSKRRKQHKRR